MYCLKKIALIASLNMGRIKIVWNRIWSIIRDHFNEIGSSCKVDIAERAIILLKELAKEFLQREEYFNF